jgi:hypothetical protein
MAKLWKKLGIIVPIVVVAAAFMLRHAISNIGFTDNVFLGIITTLEMMIGILGIFALYAVPIINTVFLARRCSSDMFSDKGYLTFALPVKREVLFGSKVLNAIVYNAFATVLEIVCILIYVVVAIPGGKGYFNFSIIGNIFKGLFAILKEGGFPAFVILFEVGVILMLASVLSVVFLHYCVVKVGSFGGFGMFIGVCLGIGFASTFIFSTSFAGLDVYMSALSDNAALAVVILFLLAVIAAIAALCGILYSKSLYKLEHKLNLT